MVRLAVKVRKRQPEPAFADVLARNEAGYCRPQQLLAPYIKLAAVDLPPGRPDAQAL